MTRTTLAVFITFSVIRSGPLECAELFVSPTGNDAHPGTQQQPLATLQRARDVARQIQGEPIHVFLREGTHYLDQPVVFEPSDSGTEQAPVIWDAFPDETPVVSGGRPMQLNWTPYRDGIMQASVPAGLTTDQLFVNGQRLQMARYPNYDPRAQYFNGSAADCIGLRRAVRWKDPRGGYFHAMHNSHWGDMHFLIVGKDARGNVRYEGGWQNNRKSNPHAEHRFVENIFEELDAPGEWFHDQSKQVLYLYPPAGIDLNLARIETVRLEQLFEFRGSRDNPVRFITLRNLILTHTARTFMKNREPLVRSDWTTWRGGAVMIDGAEDCQLQEMTIRQVGSNGVFVNGYNRRIGIEGCLIVEAGASSISFVGDLAALRSPLLNYHETNQLEQMDPAQGPKSDEFPADCRVADCLLTRNGRFEKQTAGVNICMSAAITIRHCSIYDVPRAGINICDGAFGGHLIEHCDVFDTVKETGDHGSFNSWGRDRFWHPDRKQTERWLAQHPEMAKWDAQRTTVLRNNRWRCDRGWDIDLDDGSSNYHIYNNLCLSGGIKLREGYHRVVENNVLVNNTFHPHVWYRNSDSAFRRNIVFAPHAPAGMKQDNYGPEIDRNLLHVEGGESGQATALQAVSGADERSMTGDALFIDPAKSDYRVHGDSPAIQIGFRNFRMTGFGVKSARLRSLARRPILPGSPEELQIVNDGWGQAKVMSPHKDSMTTHWQGAMLKNVQTEAEMSAAGLDSVRGVLVVLVRPDSPMAKFGLREGDVILALDDPVNDVRDFLGRLRRRKAGAEFDVKVCAINPSKLLPTHLSDDEWSSLPDAASIGRQLGMLAALFR